MSPDKLDVTPGFRSRSLDSQPRLLPLPLDAPLSQRIRAGPQGISVMSSGDALRRLEGTGQREGRDQESSTLTGRRMLPKT